MFLYKKITQHGFSLVELSVVLTIIGVVIAGALDLATNKTEESRIATTNARMDAIEKALQIFVINNQRMPCPADGSLVLTNANAGKAGAASPSGANGVCAGSNFSVTNVYSNAVPTKTLGLPDTYMVDGWDRRFTYVVDARFANDYTTNSGCASSVCFKQATAGGITVNDSGGIARSTEAIYVLISHGKNGFGAFKYTGSATRLPASADANEMSNAGNDAAFDAVFVQADTSSTFDDIARYKTKTLLIDSVGGITDSTTCTAAYDADTLNTDPTTTDPCPNADAPSQAVCYALAAVINKLCLQP